MDAIGSVREGMDVFDAQGNRIGKVAAVKMGDPEAVTAQGQESEGVGGFIGSLASSVVGPSLPEGQEERLLRLGYIEINPSGLGAHRFESAEAIDRVTDDGVVLTSDAAAAD